MLRDGAYKAILLALKANLHPNQTSEISPNAPFSEFPDTLLRRKICLFVILSQANRSLHLAPVSTFVLYIQA